MTHRLTVAALAAAILLILACGADGNGEIARTGERTVPAARELDCTARDYPCAWSDASPAASSRTDDIMQIAAALLSRGDSVDDVAAAIEAAPDVVDIAYDPLGIMFRVDGGVPVWIDVDPTGTGQLLSGATQPPPGTQLPSLAQSGGAFTGCTKGSDNSDGEPGVTLKPGEGKKALVLSPWQFGLPWDVDTLTDNLLMPGSKYLHAYGGSVTTIQTPAAQRSVLDADAANVVPAHFCGWEQYDTIILMTHGRALCNSFENGEGQGCLTSFSVGQYSETSEELKALVGSAKGVTVATSSFDGKLPNLTETEWDACLDALEELVYPEGTAEQCFQQLPEPTYNVKVTTDFFTENYPSGLPDRLIFIAACQGMKLKDIAAVLGVGNGKGQIFGFNQIATVQLAQPLLEEFTQRVGHGERLGLLYKLWANDFLDEHGANPDLWEFPLSDLPGGELGDLVDQDETPAWGSDAVRILSAGTELIDGSKVRLANPALSPGTNALELALVLTDVEDGEALESYAVEVRFNGERLDLDDVNWKPGERTSFSANVTVELPHTLEPDETFDLEIRAQLPAADGALTWWAYEDLTVVQASAVITIGGQTWEFEVVDDVFGCQPSDDDSTFGAYGYPEENFDVMFAAFLNQNGVGTNSRLVADNLPNLIVTDDANDQIWVADATDPAGFNAAIEAIPGGASQIDTLTIEGGHAWGTATFIERNAVELAWSNNTPLPAPISGSFDIQCGS